MINYEELTSILKKRKESLQKDIKDLNNMYQFELAQSFASFDTEMFYVRMPLANIGSVYHTCRETIIKKISMTLEPLLIKKLEYHMQENGCMENTQFLALYCSSYKSSEDGVILTLEDVYYQFQSLPIIGIGYKRDEIEDHILNVKVTFRSGWFVNAWSLACEVVDVMPFSMNNIYDYSTKRMIEQRDKEYFQNLLECSNYSDNIDAIMNFVNDRTHKGALVNGNKQLLKERGYILLREQFRDVAIILKSNRIECIIQEAGALSQREYQTFLNYNQEELDFYCLINGKYITLAESY
jgi:hypothetical protein